MMKSKRFSAIIMAALMALSLLGCGSDAASDPAPETAADSTAQPTAESTLQPTAEPTTQPMSEPTAEPTTQPTSEPTTQPTTQPTSEPTTQPTTEPTADVKPLPQVDYSGNVTDWMYDPESEDDLVNLLVSIDTVPHGAAGASLQEANAAVCLMQLAMEDHDQAVNAVTTYLSGMSDTQKDFFSFQWQQALKLANGLLDGSEDTAILDDSGNHDFDLSSVDSTKVTALDQSVTDLLRNAGVTDEWKNQTDQEIFQVAS